MSTVSDDWAPRGRDHEAEHWDPCGALPNGSQRLFLSRLHSSLLLDANSDDPIRRVVGSDLVSRHPCHSRVEHLSVHSSNAEISGYAKGASIAGTMTRVLIAA